MYLGWVNLQNMTRIAANFAGQNAEAMAGSGPIHDAALARYRQLVTNDAKAINCKLDPDPIKDPAATPADLAAMFPSGTDLGDTAHVTLDCDFGIITPIISNILGKPVTVSASSDFPIRNGIVAGVPAAAAAPSTPGSTSVLRRASAAGPRRSSSHSRTSRPAVPPRTPGT